ncbi:MAG TPA: vWA domain-containing protein [Gammaproteobacteria bacterium]|nr:vWA domain-containing protein [Gammaproteobacteria bacterium]
MNTTLSRCLLLLSTAGLVLLASGTARALPGNTNNPPKIQLAILLDTSSSMDGLIDQTRNQLWQVVNEFAKAKKNGVSPVLEVAVYEYGNDNLSAENGYIRQVTGLTRELDKVSEALFALTTNGGNEYCGQAIDTALKSLQWSRAQGDIKAIFIAGNEAFNQGPLPGQQAVTAARSKGITVNTIHAGSYEEGAQGGWKEGALLAGGNYMSIDQNQQIVQIVAPQDQKLAELNVKLNQTYLPYGAEGAAAAARQSEQDTRNAIVSLGQLAQRVKSKVSALYDNSNWDLVDALESGAVKLEEVKPAALPEPMRSMDKKEQEKFLAEKAGERKALQEQIAELAKARDAYVATAQAKVKPAAPTVSEALTEAVRAEGKKKDFDFN